MTNGMRALGSVRRRLSLLLFGVGGAVVVGLPALLGAIAGAGPAVVTAAATLGALCGAMFALVRGIPGRIAWLGRRMETRVADVERELDSISARVVEAPVLVMERLDQVEAHLRRSVEEQTSRRAAEIQGAGELHYRQLESLISLHGLVDVHGVVPPSRGWAASPDLLLAYVGEILSRRPSLVVECGSGLSTLWAAYAIELCGTGRVVALEHDPQYAEQTRALLRGHGVAGRAEVRLAPIGEAKVGEELHPWYDTDQIEDLREIGVLFVDGPIGSLAPQSRYPAVPLLRTRLAPGAAVLLDDADRADERAIADRWAAGWPGLTVTQLPHEKGTVLLRVPD